MKKRLHLATPGIVYRVASKKKLNALLKTGNFLLINIIYVYRKWWQFWKIKKVLYYEVMCIKDIEI